MFADDINLFYSHQNISTIKCRTRKVVPVFKTNKFSLSIKKTKSILFHKHSSKDDIPLKLPDKKKNSSIKILK